MAAKPRANVDEMDGPTFLRWFLQNHDSAVLIEAGVWMKARYIVEDHAGDDDLMGAMRAAYKLGGADAAWALLMDAILQRMPGASRPDLPPRWKDELRGMTSAANDAITSCLARSRKDRW